MKKNKLESKRGSENDGFEDEDNTTEKNSEDFHEVSEKNTNNFLEVRGPCATEMDVDRHSIFGSKFSEFSSSMKGRFQTEKWNASIFRLADKSDVETISMEKKQEEETSFTTEAGLELFDPDCKLKDDTTVDAPNNDYDYQRPAKLGLFVGLLRLVNVLSAVTAVVGNALHLNATANFNISTIWRNETDQYDYDDYNDNLDDDQLYDEYMEYTDYSGDDDVRIDDDTIEGQYEYIVSLAKDSREMAQDGCGVLLLLVMTIVCCLVMVDNIATVTFRWKHYGELTHRHTDATSIIFLISPQRWTFRFLSALAIASSASLRTATSIISYFGKDKSNPFNPSSKGIHAMVWYLCLTSGSLVACVLGFLLHWIPPTWRSVPWLDNSMTDAHVDDVGDTWKSVDELKNKRKSKFVLKNVKLFKKIHKVIMTINKIVLYTCLLVSLAMNGIVFILVNDKMYEIASIISIVRSSSCCLMCFYFLISLTIDCIKYPYEPGPFLSRLFVPIILSYSFSLLLDIVPEQKGILVTIYIICITLFVFMQLVNLFIIVGRVNRVLDHCFCKFIYNHFWLHKGAYKKIIRVLDTLGNFLALLGLLTGFCSLFIDQYDVDFQLTGQLKTMKDGFEDFSKGINDVVSAVKKLIKQFDFKITCEHIYAAISAGTAATLLASIIPGGSAVAKIGSKSAYYSVKVGGALTRLAKMLKKSAKIPWHVFRTIRKIKKFSFLSFKPLTIGGSSPSLLRLLTFLPPVVIGIFVLFSSFWPQRILFFSKKQRIKFTNEQWMNWILKLFLLLLALAINTFLVEELLGVMNESLPFIQVGIKKKWGWTISLFASGFAIAACLAFILSYTVIILTTTRNHQRLTDEENSWKNELEKRQLVRFKTRHGDKIEHRNQVRYKKERIGPWTWSLPILLCLFALGFAFLGSQYMKMEISREPKGTVGREIDKLADHFSNYKSDKNDVNRYVESECLKFPSLKDVLEQSMRRNTSILLGGYHAFFNKMETLMAPMKKLVDEARHNLTAKIINTKDVKNVKKAFRVMQKFELKYVGLLLLIPRVVCLLILIFGMIAASLNVCLMRIFDPIEPKKIVNAYGAVCIFSIIYVLGVQIAIANVLSTFGIPFYNIKVSYDLGFIYDVVCEIIMVSVYIGMKNEFFFAIPKRKVSVTYEVPGASDDGTKIHGQIR